MKLKLHKVINRTVANGPGKRVGVWFQGCTLGCKGCFNQQTHPIHGGMQITTDEFIEQFLAPQIGNPEVEGVTFSGGEPLQQWSALKEILTWVSKNAPAWSVIVFTGYTLDELSLFPWQAELRSTVDVIIAGRYQQENRQATKLIGSSNKEMLFCTERYSQGDFQNIPTAEVRIAIDGSITMTGIRPVEGMPA